MLTIVMKEDKTLLCNQSVPIYQYENNADMIRCLIPLTYEGICMNDAIITVIFEDEKGNGSAITLESLAEKYNANYYQYTSRIDDQITQFVGKITVWLKINHYDPDYAFEVRESSFKILPNKNVPESLSQKIPSYFNLQRNKMKELQNTANKALEEATIKANKAKLEAEKAISHQKEIYGGENNGNN